jgi:hypothetical protein
VRSTSTSCTTCRKLTEDNAEIKRQLNEYRGSLDRMFGVAIQERVEKKQQRRENKVGG